jgi:hypothetical protein
VAVFNTVILKGKYGEYYSEDVNSASNGVMPGHLMIVGSDLKVDRHLTAGGTAENRVALEEFFQGGTIDNSYSSGAIVRSKVFQPGEEAYMLLAASASSLTPADFVTSAGDGTVKKSTATSEWRFGKPLASVDNSGNSLTARVPVRFI